MVIDVIMMMFMIIIITMHDHVADHMIERTRNKQKDFCLKTSEATKMEHALSLLLDRP